jgi:outer membrane protein
MGSNVMHAIYLLSLRRTGAWAALAVSVAAHGQVAQSQVEESVSAGDENVERLLHAIDRIEADGQSTVRARIDVAAGHDSNVNSAPGVSSVAVPARGGSILALDPAGTRKSGNFVRVAADISGRLVLGPRFSLIGTAMARTQQFNRANEGNDQVDANAGVSYRVDGQEYTLAAQFGTLRIDGDRARDSRSLVGEWTYRFGGFGQFNAYFEAGRLAYPRQHTADANRNVIGATYAHRATTGVWAFGGVYLGRETVLDTTSRHLGHELAGARAGVQVPLRESLYGFVSSGFERRRYDGENPLFLTVRRDNQVNISAGLYWIPSPYWRVTPQLLWIRTGSTVPLAEFQKRAISIAVLREF